VFFQGTGKLPSPAVDTMFCKGQTLNNSCATVGNYSQIPGVGNLFYSFIYNPHGDGLGKGHHIGCVLLMGLWLI
jgi:hypothetical protein